MTPRERVMAAPHFQSRGPFIASDVAHSAVMKTEKALEIVEELVEEGVLGIWPVANNRLRVRRYYVITNTQRLIRNAWDGRLQLPVAA